MDANVKIGIMMMQPMPSSKLTPCARILQQGKHNLAEGRTLEEVVVHQYTFYSSLRKPECCEEMIDVLFGLKNHGFI